MWRMFGRRDGSVGRRSWTFSSSMRGALPLSFYSSFPLKTREDADGRWQNAQTRRLASQRAQDSSRHFPCFPRRHCYGSTRRVRPLANSLRRQLFRASLPPSLLFRLKADTLFFTVDDSRSPLRQGSSTRSSRFQLLLHHRHRFLDRLHSSPSTYLAVRTRSPRWRMGSVRFFQATLSSSQLTVLPGQSSPLVRDALQWCLLGDSCGE